ncbi:hypothetical protein [Desulfotignum balticum]|uniref:hypothetical protein n=1 Tax=Desulfotignum balticum TaxID=115781 RepID=UPI00040826BF|nr:hypothetical protein [Desulfotignum balticum]
MGKGTIISGGTDGQYQVSVVYNTDRAQAENTANLAKIANLETQIASEENEQALNILKLQKLSLEKRNEILDNIPESETISAWCVDLTEDLAGDVGLIEVPGESVAFNIQPGYDEKAVYDPARDGQLSPTMAITPAAAFYNLAMLPGWQKWKPTYRYGTITAIAGDLASVALEAVTSTQQALGINQASTLNNVPVEYMSCNGAAFAVGDEVLVKFTGQDWGRPVVVGFKDSPKMCGWVENWENSGTATGAGREDWIKTQNNHWLPYQYNSPDYFISDNRLKFNHPGGSAQSINRLTYWSRSWDGYYHWGAFGPTPPLPYPFPDPNPPNGFILNIKGRGVADGGSFAYVMISDRPFEFGAPGSVRVVLSHGPDFDFVSYGQYKYIDASGTDEYQVFDLRDYGIENPLIHCIEITTYVVGGAAVSLDLDHIKIF